MAHELSKGRGKTLRSGTRVSESSRGQCVEEQEIALGIGSGSTYELGHEGNHQVEKTNGLDESETQNGVREELATEGRVAGNTVEESGEDETDTDTGTSQTDGGGTHTQVLGDLDHGVGDLRRVGAALDLEGIAGGSLEEGGGLLALEGLERRACARGIL